jgi:hypothetical protein
MRLAATPIQFACKWRPLGYNLHATGGHMQAHVLRRFSDFLMASSFFNSNNCSRSVLAKKMAALHATGRWLQGKRQVDKRYVKGCKRLTLHHN